MPPKDAVLYFDQRTHACAWSKMIKKHLKSMKKVPFPSCIPEANVRRMKEKVGWSAIGSDSQKLVVECSLVEIHNTSSILTISVDVSHDLAFLLSPFNISTLSSLKRIVVFRDTVITR